MWLSCFFTKIACYLDELSNRACNIYIFLCLIVIYGWGEEEDLSFVFIIFCIKCASSRIIFCVLRNWDQINRLIFWNIRVNHYLLSYCIILRQLLFTISSIRNYSFNNFFQRNLDAKYKDNGAIWFTLQTTRIKRFSRNV